MVADKWDVCINSKNLLPLKVAESSNCKVNKQDVKGGKIVFDFTCQVGGLKSRYHGEVIYDKDKLTGNYVMETGEIQGNYNIEGERVGECD